MDRDLRGYEFSGFRIDAASRELFGPDGEPVPLASKTLDVLLHLIEQRDRVVAKSELLAAVWSGRVVEVNNLTQAISSLRKAFAARVRERRFILTFPNRGYRFVAELAATPYDSRRRASGATARDPTAERLYLAGRDLIDAPNMVRVKRAIGIFRQVLEIDPGHSRAWSGLAFAWRALTMNADMDPRQAFPPSNAAVERALALDPGSAQAHAARAFNLYWNDWDWHATARACEQSIRLDPGVADGHFVYAHLLHNLGHFDAALEQARIARELNPLAPLINTMEAGFLAAAGRAQESRKRVDHALDIAPDYWAAFLVRGGMLIAHGDPAAAVEVIERAAKLSGRSSLTLAMLAPALIASGDRAGAEQLREELWTLSEATYVPGTCRAAISNALGNHEEALDLLELAYAQRDVRMTFLKTDARWNNLRTQPRFAALMQRMGFVAGAARGVL